MTNIFKRLDLIGAVHKELLTKFSDIVQEAVIKTIPKKKKSKKAKQLRKEEKLKAKEKRKAISI